MNCLFNVIKIENLSEAEKSSFRKSMDGIGLEVVKQIGGDSQRVYDLIIEGKKQFKARKK